LTLVVVSAQRSVRISLPSMMTCDQPYSATSDKASCRSGAWAASTVRASSR